jgi:hypothetical protein
MVRFLNGVPLYGSINIWAENGEFPNPIDIRESVNATTIGCTTLQQMLKLLGKKASAEYNAQFAGRYTITNVVQRAWRAVWVELYAADNKVTTLLGLDEEKWAKWMREQISGGAERLEMRAYVLLARRKADVIRWEHLGRASVVQDCRPEPEFGGVCFF